MRKQTQYEATGKGFNIMINRILTMVAFLLFSKTVFAGDLSYFDLTAEQTTNIAILLNRYDKGEIGYHDLYQPQTPERERQLVGYYLSHSNSVPIKAMYPLAVSYWGFRQWQDSIQILNSYLKEYPKDARAFRLLGVNYVELNETNQSLDAFDRATDLGDIQGAEGLLASAAKYGKLERVSSKLSVLVKLAEGSKGDRQERMDLNSCLTGYALVTKDKELFVRILRPLSIEDVALNDDLGKNATTGCAFFGEQGSNAELKKICEKLKAFSENSSATNAVK